MLDDDRTRVVRRECNRASMCISYKYIYIYALPFSIDCASLDPARCSIELIMLVCGEVGRGIIVCTCCGGGLGVTFATLFVVQAKFLKMSVSVSIDKRSRRHSSQQATWRPLSVNDPSRKSHLRCVGENDSAPVTSNKVFVVTFVVVVIAIDVAAVIVVDDIFLDQRFADKTAIAQSS